MNLRRLVVAAGILVMGCLLGYRAGSAEPAAKGAKPEPVAVRYARAQLQLAEATLRKAQDMNQKVAETISSGLVAQFADDVQVAKALLQSAEGPAGANPLAGWLVRADYAVRAAESKWKKANEVNQIELDTFADVDIERLRLGVVIAKLQLERGKAMTNASSEAKTQWQVDMLFDELSRLRDRTSIIFQDRGPSDF